MFSQALWGCPSWCSYELEHLSHYVTSPITHSLTESLSPNTLHEEVMGAATVTYLLYGPGALTGITTLSRQHHYIAAGTSYQLHPQKRRQASSSHISSITTGSLCSSEPQEHLGTIGSDTISELELWDLGCGRHYPSPCSAEARESWTWYRWCSLTTGKLNAS